jgi:hypothetical protein
MKRLLLILILTFSFQSWTKADDIRDFEIDSLTLGSSLLDFLKVEEIENLKKLWYPSKKFYIISVSINIISNMIK